LDSPLDQIGENLTHDLAECKDPKKDPKIALSKNPITCQAVKVVPIGWLFGSVKSMNEKTSVQSIRKELNIPPKSHSESDEGSSGTLRRKIPDGNKMVKDPHKPSPLKLRSNTMRSMHHR
jgi:hypothetical protein